MTNSSGKRPIKNKLNKEGYVFFLARSPLAPMTTTANGFLFQLSFDTKSFMDDVPVPPSASNEWFGDECAEEEEKPEPTPLGEGGKRVEGGEGAWGTPDKDLRRTRLEEWGRP